MANNGFIGSICVFNSVTLDVLDAQYQEEVAKVEVTGNTTSELKYVAGQPDKTLNVTVSGTISALFNMSGSHGALTFNWNDGDQTNIALAMLTSIGKAGAKGDRIKNTVVFVPYGGPS